MKRLETWLMAGTALAAAAAAVAAETITYRYDARGRLVKVEHAGSVNNNVATNYSYDKADNRTQVATATETPPPPSAPSFSIANAPAVAEGGTLVFTVTKTGTTSSTYSVDYATGTGGTATSGTDFTAASGTLSFTPAQTSQTVSVATTDDSAVEADETVPASLSAPSGGATISTAQASGTINNNDSASNNPPVAGNASITLHKCEIAFLDVGASDPDGDLPLNVTAVTQTSGHTDGQVLFSGGTTVEIWASYFAGTSTYSYTVEDSRGATAQGILTVTVFGGVC